jgi:hypothetical protein
MEDQLFGVPVTRDLPCTLTEPALREATAQKAEIEDCGLTIVRVHMVAPDQPLRFFIKFKPGQPSFATRGKLEALGYSVRQKMSDKDLCFYAVKSVVETKGWDV